MNRLIHKTLLFAAAAIAMVAVATACTESDGALSLSLRITGTGPSPSNQYISVGASGSWTLSLIYADRSETDFTPWCYFNTNDTLTVISGTGSQKGILLNWIKNASPQERSVSLELKSGSRTVYSHFTQQGAGSNEIHYAASLVSDELGNWMELPAPNTEGLYYFTHTMEIAGKAGRNYTFGWDPKNLVARWVAYPLNGWSISSGSRSNVWGVDPKLPRQSQPVLYSPYSSGNSGQYDRGHQIPSADRLSYDANLETFYGTNMTPQMNSFNAAAWGVLEGMVRTWARKFDTLYVATGCIVEGSTKYVYDNDRKKVTVPTGYFKALLGYKKSGTIGISSTTGGYTAIGFYFNHQRYDSSPNAIMEQSTTIEDLEERTGFNFFVNLHNQIGAEYAKKVETTVDPWWSNN